MDLDLNDPTLLLRDDVLEDPRPLYDKLRREAPVWRLPGQDTFLVTSPNLIREAVGRPTELSSNLVSLLHNDGTGCPVAFSMAPFGDPIHVLSTADPPVHTRHRKLLQAHLTPAAVAELEPTFRGIADRHLDALLSTGRGDAAALFSDPVPASAMCAFVGLPLEDVPRIIQMVAGTGGLLDGVTDIDGMHAAMTSAMELTVYVQRALEAARQRPPRERTALLAVFAAGIEEGVVNADEVRDMLVVLVSAGSETTSSLLATAIARLAGDPDLQSHLRGNPAAIPAAIEDFLRDDGPFQFHYRWTTNDTVLGGTPIPAHSRVLLMWAAANRPAPEGSGAAPEAPEPGRQAPHYAFGRGLHTCIGAPVARLEARVAIEQLLARTSSITLDPDRAPTRRPSIFIRRLASLPVVVEAA